MLISQGSIVSCHSLAVVWIFACLYLIDKVTHRQCMILCSAEYKSLLILIDLVHENFNSLSLAFFDFDDFIEIALCITLSRFDFAFDQLVIGCIDIVVECCGNLLHLEWREEPIIDTFLERVDINRLAEVIVSVHVILALRRGR